ncbi:unnamed protein product, partial [Meganyctiphanes norvegica]
MKKQGLLNIFRSARSNRGGYEKTRRTSSRERWSTPWKDPSEWSITEVGQWLDTQGFSDYAEKFAKHKVDGLALLLLTENELKVEMDIKVLGDLKRLVVAILELQQKTSLPFVPIAQQSFPYTQSLLSPFGNKHVFHQSHLGTNSTSSPMSRCRHHSSDSQTSEKLDSTLNEPSVYHRGSGRATALHPEYVKTIVAISYMFLVTWITAIVMVFVHDRVPDTERHPPLPDIFLDNVPHISWAFQLCEITILLLTTTWVIILFFHKHRSIALRRFSALSGSVFLLRCATMFITSLSVPGSHLDCAPRAPAELSTKIHQAWIIWQGGGLSIKGVRTCGDYMFSGHTTALTILNFFITEYTPRRMYYLHICSWVLNVFGIFFILAAHEHYSIDVFIAFYITSRMFMYYHSLANNRALHQRDSFRTKIWFPMFSYFEANIDGIIPNEYSNPLKEDNLKWFWNTFVMNPFLGLRMKKKLK